jgi:sulfite exporter TauE/SafE
MREFLKFFNNFDEILRYFLHDVIRIGTTPENMIEQFYFIPVVAGLLAGLGHVFSGPDHIAAIAPLAIDAPRKAWKTGLRWGIGHTSGVLVIGILSLFLRDLLPIDLISNWSERLVGVLLIAIGFWGIRKAMLIHAHEHEHHGEKHMHIHMHGKNAEVSVHNHTHTAFGIGTIHGLAGSAHFFGILPAMAFKSSVHSAVYLICFGLGTIVAMSGFSAVISNLTNKRSLQTINGYRNLMCSCSAIALGVGVYWLAS